MKSLTRAKAAPVADLASCFTTVNGSAPFSFL